MDEWLGIEHLFELSASEAIWGFLTPLFVFIAFFVVQLILSSCLEGGFRAM